MSTQKKVWIGVAVLAGVALLAPTYTAYAQRQREAANASAVRAAQLEVEASRWEAMAEWYKSHPASGEAAPVVLPHVYDATGAMQAALAVDPLALPSTGYEYVDGTTASLLAAEHPWTSGNPRPVYDATGAMLDALAPDPVEAPAGPAPEIDWYAVRGIMTPVPGYDPSAPVPTVVPQGP